MTTGEWSAALAGWETAQRAANRSPGTIKLYRHYVDQCITGNGPADVDAHSLTRLLATPGWSAETRKSCRAGLRSFFRWAHGIGLLEDDPSVYLPTVRVPSGQARPAPETVFKRALAIAGTRERVMLMLAGYCGLRAAEIARVHRGDLVQDLCGWSLVVHGKGGKDRHVPIVHAELLEHLQLADGWLFPSRAADREHLTAGTVTRYLSRVLDTAWTGHTLRHRAGTVAYAGTRDLLAVMTMLGHTRPETTRRYIKMPDDAVRAALRAAAA